MTLTSSSSGQKTKYRENPRAGVNKSRADFVADFETSTPAWGEDGTRVWAWGLTNVHNSEVVEFGNNIESFIERIQKYNTTTYFHNLKFDAWFIVDYLLNLGFEHDSNSRGAIRPGTFKSLISDMGKWYSVTVKWENGHTTEFRDSLKKLPMSVKHIAKSFKLEEEKGELDYDTFRPIGHILTEEEKDYVRRDVQIVAHAIKEAIDNGMVKLTVASDSLAEYKRLVGSKFFSRSFPVFSEYLDAEIRRAYRGGFTYADTRFRKRRVGSGLVLDVNSLYPYIMKDRVLPYGEPEFVEGKVNPTAARPLTIFSVTFTARLKPDHIPCIQIKGHSMFGGTEYLTEVAEPVTLMVTNVDWSLYHDHYDIEVQAYGGGYRFHAAQGMFDAYIDKWSAVKASETGGKREIAKLHLNSLYGKFASNPNVTSKMPVLIDGVVHLVRGEDETRPPVYTAVGVFVTSFARDLTVRAAQENYHSFAYADTDSLHLLQDTIPENIDVHPTRLGAWKHEYNFENAYYIRPKAYLERTGKIQCEDDYAGHTHVDSCYYVNRIAGVHENVSRKLTFDDVYNGNVIQAAKLEPKAVRGGLILRPSPFELKDVVANVA